MIKSNTFNIKNIATITILAIFFIFDRYLKQVAVNNNPNLNLLGEYLKFTFSKNFNIAFSLPVSGMILNIIIVSIIIGLIFYLIYLIKHKYSHIVIIALFALILGALSNALDRLIYGYVIDYLDILNFTVLNIADILISSSAFILILLNFSSSKYNKKNHL
ncbi:MAG TPA: signal peptidase II [Patescibacteria group bacterium]|nr:signal peptidase II [Patescibacteria group bacterium]